MQLQKPHQPVYMASVKTVNYNSFFRSPYTCSQVYDALSLCFSPIDLSSLKHIKMYFNKFQLWFTWLVQKFFFVEESRLGLHLLLNSWGCLPQSETTRNKANSQRWHYRKPCFTIFLFILSNQFQHYTQFLIYFSVFLTFYVYFLRFDYLGID